MRTVELRVDVTEATGLDETLEVAATVFLPDHVESSTLVCFAWPGGGYSRRYFSFDLPGYSGGGEAGWHTDRGWIFVAVDTLNTGDSSLLADPGALTYENLAASNEAVVDHVLSLLADATLAEDLGPVVDPTVIGLGQSLGGSLVVLTQGQRNVFDAIGVLGFSGHHTMIWAPPEKVSGERVYIPRGTNISTLTEDVFVAAMPEMAFDDNGWPLCAPGFHLDDVPREIVHADMHDYPTRSSGLPAWGSATIPPCAMTMMSPGAIAPEAARVATPVFIGVGELDTVPRPKEEPTAYQQSDDVTVFRCPGVAHMHNFGTTRERMWARFHSWADGVAFVRSATSATEHRSTDAVVR